ncbi:hypothetical protein GGR42_001040 [Saonia flava]|uniref:peptidylprolyl isomerase n=1 Tax=Saonia flava TaxID=523696 RepID=A0A846QR46_9FLAO|nr:FKBP-type peptidyl-prolyl cis-trans isomerase [Saonia flava]NJB70578.1 hypothetical protein [Saonia flava]
MKTKQLFYLLIILGTVVGSCKKDDGSDIEVIPPRLLSEVAAENEEEIQDFLKTHFYNYEEFNSPPADFNYKIKLDTIAGSNSGKTPLIDQMESIIINVSSDAFSGLEEEDKVQHKLYFLSVREGEGTNPTVADSTLVRYEGSLLNGTVFDGAFNTALWFDLGAIQGTGARGFSEGSVNFKSGGEVIVNNDGTFTVDGYGVGLMIFPSGLGYFSNSQTNIPAYSPLIFKVDMFTHTIDTDHDNDGIPSILEDLNMDGYLYNDNTDRDEEEDAFSPAFSNFVDSDDDNDGILTREEISDDNGNIVIPYPDSDGDGTPDYLDPDN